MINAFIVQDYADPSAPKIGSFVFHLLHTDKCYFYFIYNMSRVHIQYLRLAKRSSSVFDLFSIVYETRSN